MLRRCIACVKDDRGAEVLEFVAVGSGILAVAIAVYPGVLQAGLEAVIDALTARFLAL